MPTYDKDLVARYKKGAPKPKSDIINLPALYRDRFRPRPAPIPLGQLKRRPYNPAVAGRRIDEASSIGSRASNIPENQQWANKARKQRSDIIGSLQQSMTMPNTSQWSVPAVARTLGMGKSPGGNFNRLVAAIKRKESSGNYNARNPHSGALGAYQVLPGNVGPWSREILGRTVSTSEFLNSPQLQDAIAIGKLRQYYQKYGPAGAATAWYAGPGAVSSKMHSTTPQGQYPSIRGYWGDILRMM